MNIFNVIDLFGGLALFLYGMRIMGAGLKESASGTLKKALESVTNSKFKAFLLGLMVTAVIQSSTATIVITSGLVAAGLLTLRQSLGIIVGANVGTTVTGQIIRLLDVDASGSALLKFFQPSTLAPIALAIGIILIMFCKFRSSDTVGGIAIGFGILFTGLMNMTASVDSLSASGVFEELFSHLSSNPFLGYAIGFAVSFVLQSSSATVGILQAFSSGGDLPFKAIYAVLMGIYLGDCVTTAIVCAIGAKSDAKRVGIYNVLFNLGKSAIVLVGVTIVHKLGLIDGLWNKTVTPGIIADTNTIFNLACALLLLPLLETFEKLSCRIVKDEPVPAFKYADRVAELNPAFAETPALALNACYDTLCTMFDVSRDNLLLAFDLVEKYDDRIYAGIEDEENNVDVLADSLNGYLVALSKTINAEQHVLILDSYHKLNIEFERLSDHSINIAEYARTISDADEHFSGDALAEIQVLYQLVKQILEYSESAFKQCDVEAATHIEPLEEVVDDLVLRLKDNHMRRLRKGMCNTDTGSVFLNFLSDMERISDVCSNIGIATIARTHPEIAGNSHAYTALLHENDRFNREYRENYEKFFSMLPRPNREKH